MKKIRNNLIIVALLVIGIVSGIVFSTSYTKAANLPDTPEQAAEMYIKYMQTGNFNKEAINTFFTGGLGKTYMVQGEQISLEEAEQKGLLGQTADTAAVLVWQRDHIKKLFGETAWDNASFTLKKVNSGAMKEQWVEKKSGKHITEKEGTNQLNKYWKEIASREGVTIEDIFNYTTARNGEVADEKYLKVLKIKEKYEKDAPVEITFVPQFEVYEADLQFGNMSAAASGESEFRFYIANEKGKWSLYDGLNWNLPESEATTDI